MVLNGASVTPLLAPSYNNNNRMGDFGGFGSPINPTPVATKIHRDKMYNRVFTKKFTRSQTDFGQDLQPLRLGLFWMALDQSSTFQTLISWLIFFALVFVVPVLEIMWITCTDCKSYNIAENIFESALAAVSFLILSSILRKHGLRKVLLLHNLKKESKEVQTGYTELVTHAFHSLFTMLIPLFLIEAPIRIWWYSKASVDIPGLDIGKWEEVILWAASMVSWTYKTGMFFLMCMLFRLMCSLQTLRLDAFHNLLGETKDAPTILAEYMSIRHQISKISDRGSLFLFLSLFTITISQASSLVLLLLSPEELTFVKASGLAINSVVQILGIVLCLNGAVSISHRAGGIVAAVSEWHAVTASDTPSGEPTYGVLDFCKNQALVTYMQMNMAGISVFGYTLDRGTLYGVFVIEFTLILFIMGQTVGQLLH